MIPPDSSEMFSGAMRAMGRQDLTEDPRFASPSERLDHATELFEIIKDWTKSRDKRDVMAAFAGEGVPCGAVFDTKEVISQPHLIERGMVQEIEHPTRGKHPVIGCPVRLSESPVELTRAPLYGEHSNEVFTKLGGLTQAEVDQLRREKVIL
jgi:formyl-CoA transferase